MWKTGSTDHSKSITFNFGEMCAANANHLRLNYSQIRGIEIPFPQDESEFDRISGKLISFSEALGFHQVELAKLTLIKTALMQDLLTGKVRVDNLISHV